MVILAEIEAEAERCCFIDVSCIVDHLRRRSSYDVILCDM